MNILLDACVWGGAAEQLRACGYDVVSVADWHADPGDDQILERAYLDRRILVTLDKDFGELAIVRGRPHAGVIRLVGFRAQDQAHVCDRVLATYGEELQGGAIATAQPGRIRIRIADPPNEQD